MKPALLALSLFLGSLASFAQNKDFYLKDGDRVVFYGDSITDQRQYTVFTEDYIVTRFPDKDIYFVHSGWGGDRVTGGGGGPIDRRLKRDVFAYKPTVMTIMLGINDASYRPFDEQIFQTYSTGYEHIIDSMKKEFPKTRITVIQPSPYDDVTKPLKINGVYNSVLVRYGDFVKQLAAKDGLNVADLNTPVVEALKKAKDKNAELAAKIIPDYVHPGPAGHLIMAGALLKSWNAPALVSSVEIDADSGKTTHTVRAKVSDLEAKETLKWSQHDEALPMPIDMGDPVVALAVNSSDFVQDLDQQLVKVTGLKAQRYSLKIDGAEAGQFSKDELASGVNISLANTPMKRQALEVHKLTVSHNDLHFARWRNIQTRYENEKLPHLEDALNGLDALEKDIVHRQREAAKPVKHTFELSPV